MIRRWIQELGEAVFCEGLYQDFRMKAVKEGRAFGIARGKFLRDMSAMVDRQIAEQYNGRSKPFLPDSPRIRVVKE